MPRNTTLREGQVAKYNGKNIEHFNAEDPYVKILGYDSNDWNLLWVEYQGQKVHVQQRDLEVVQ